MKKRGLGLWGLLLLIGVLLGLLTSSELEPKRSAAEYRVPVRMPVLAYHFIAPTIPKGSHGTITCRRFREDMEKIKALGYHAISFAQLNSYLKEGTPLPLNPILITFDDGYENNYQYAWPILKELQMKAVFFIVGWDVGMSQTPEGKRINPHFGWEEAREMVSSGVIEIGSHTYDLHSVYGKSPGTGQKIGYGARKMASETEAHYRARLKIDLMRSIADIKRELGTPPVAIAYPFGVYGQDTEAVVKTLFQGSFTINPAIHTFQYPEQLYGIPRILVDQRTDVAKRIGKAETENLSPWLRRFSKLLVLLSIPALFLLAQEYLQALPLNNRKSKAYK